MAEFGHSLAPRAEGKTPQAEALLSALESFASYDSLNGGFVVTKRKKADGPSKNPGAEAAIKVFRRRSGNRVPAVKVMDVGGARYSESALVWLWNNGCLPSDEEEMDHLNRDPWDNRIDNLRSVTHHVNLLNKTKRSDNTSGVTGINYEPAINKYRVRAGYLGKQYYCGVFVRLEDAIQARKNKLDALRAAGAEFTETHGE